MKNPPKSHQAGYPQPLQDRIAEIDYLRCLTYGLDAMPLMLPRAERVKDDRDNNGNHASGDDPARATGESAGYDNAEQR